MRVDLRTTSIIAGTILIMAGLVFFGKHMSDMTNYMGEMTSYVRSMSLDMAATHDKVSILTEEISKIDDVVAHMDSNMNAMNVDINVIQEAMSEEMSRIRGGVDSISRNLVSMDHHMAFLTSEVSKLDDLMAGMGTDIHRGTQSFTSPMNYMWNMMR